MERSHVERVVAYRMARQQIQSTPLTCICEACGAKESTPSERLSGWYEPNRQRGAMPKAVALAEAAYLLAFEMCERDELCRNVPAGHELAGGTVAELLRFALDRLDEFLIAHVPSKRDILSPRKLQFIVANNLANRIYRLAFRNAIELKRGCK